MSMELFSVKLSYAIPGTDQRGPERHETSTAVAVHGAFGPDLIRRAGEVAVKGVVGEDADPELWQIFISAINYLGSVHVEPPA